MEADSFGHDGEAASLSEFLTPGPAEALAALFDTAVPDLEAGLPLMWHGVYLLDRPPQSMLGIDGHRNTGGVVLPSAPGRRRMFAGGRVRRHGSLRCGAEATRTMRVIKRAEKSGSSGPFEVVTVLHEISQGGTVVLSEEQDIIYRPAPDGQLVGGAGAKGGAQTKEILGDELEVRIDPVLLFRFSALTYNAHRIHYDREFATLVEGYPGLVVHGPLQAVLMCEAARSQDEPPMLCSFEYRLVSPLCDGQGCLVSARREADTVVTSVTDATGRITARGVLRTGDGALAH